MYIHLIHMWRNKMKYFGPKIRTQNWICISHLPSNGIRYIIIGYVNLAQTACIMIWFAIWHWLSSVQLLLHCQKHSYRLWEHLFKVWLSLWLNENSTWNPLLALICTWVFHPGRTCDSGYWLENHHSNTTTTESPRHTLTPMSDAKICQYPL